MLNSPAATQPVQRKFSNSATSNIVVVSPDADEQQELADAVRRADFPNVFPFANVDSVDVPWAALLLGSRLNADDCLECCRRSQQLNINAPVLALLGPERLDLASELLRNGGSDYLLAPVDVSELARKLNTHLTIIALEKKFRASTVADTELLMQRKLGKSLAVSNRKLEQIVQERTLELQAMASDLETRLDRERERIAGDLHDEFGQLLSCLRLELDLLDNDISQGQPVDSRIEACHVLIDDVLSSSRGIVRGLRPPSLGRGLVAAIEELVEQAGQRYGLEVRCDLPATAAAIDPSTSLDVYRIVQEAVSNVIKHARATSLSVTGQVGSGRIEFVVVDDGIGLQADATDVDDAEDPGFGLINMRERARRLDGELTVSPREPQGVLIQLILPFSK